MLGLLDLMLRGGAVAVLALIALAVLFAGPRRRATWALALTSLALMAYLLISAPSYSGYAFAPLIALAAAAPALVWWAALELFEETDPWVKLVPPMVLAVLGLALASDYWPQAGYLRAALTLLAYGHVLLIAWRGGPTDLVEARRQLRRAVLALGAALGLVITIVETVLRDAVLPAAIFPLQAGSLLLVSGAFALWLLRVDAVLLPDPVATAPQAEAQLSDAERAILARLQVAMDRGDWQREALTIGTLAADLKTSEHRLRRVINQGLGHRNFAGFINGYRIGAARTALADLGLADRSVLEIAYDSGFASLGPFNRAFRAETGQSPTEYRARALSEKH